MWLSHHASPYPHTYPTFPDSRYDYEEVDSAAANTAMDQVRKVIAASPKGTKLGSFTVETADDFEYTDPIDGSIASKQGLRFVFTGEPAGPEAGREGGRKGASVQAGGLLGQWLEGTKPGGVCLSMVLCVCMPGLVTS